MRNSSSLLLSALLLCAPAPAWAWGSSGHRIIGRVALKGLPSGLPAFLRSKDAIWQVGELAREPDRWRTAGAGHDAELNTGHFVNMTEDGKIAGVLALSDLPAMREAYDTALRAGGSTQYKAGYLPYSIIIGFQQLRMDFAYWRADVAGAKFAKSAQAHAWFTADRKLHEMTALRDLGVWAHFVGDASQPMHVSVHHDGWGDYPNPENFTAAPGIHAKFEASFVRANVREAQISARLPPLHVCGCKIEDETKTYLTRALDRLVPLYRLDKQGAFDGANAAGKDFVTAQLAAGAAELRDLVAEAWVQSDTISVGYPAALVKDIEAGHADPLGSLQGLD